VTWGVPVACPADQKREMTPTGRREKKKGKGLFAPAVGALEAELQWRGIRKRGQVTLAPGLQEGSPPGKGEKSSFMGTKGGLFPGGKVKKKGGAWGGLSRRRKTSSWTPLRGEFVLCKCLGAGPQGGIVGLCVAGLLEGFFLPPLPERG